MSDNDVKIENVDEQETIECIIVFDHELHVLMNNISDFDDVVLGKYKKTYTKDKDLAEIFVDIHQQQKHASLAFAEDFFEDFCFSTRSERDAILQKTLKRLKEKLSN